MQSLPASQPTGPITFEAFTGLDSIPWSYRIVAGILLIAIGATVGTSQLRGAFPSTDGPLAKRLTFFYPSMLGALMGELAPFTLPGFGWRERWFLGFLAPALGVLAYEFYYKPRADRKLGVTLPSASDIVGAGAPPTTGEKS